GIFSNPIGNVSLGENRNELGSNELWNQNKLTGYLEVMIPLPTKREISLGAGFLWNNHKLDPISNSSPPSSEAMLFAENPEDLSQLDWDSRTYFKSYTFLAQSDIEIVRLGKYASFFGRAEAGLTNYRTSIRANYTNNCGCKQSLLI